MAEINLNVVVKAPILQIKDYMYTQNYMYT